MLKRISLYAVIASFISVLLTTGCAKQDVVKKDEGILPVPVAKQITPANAIEPKVDIKPNSQATAPKTAQESSKSTSMQQPQNAITATQLQIALNRIYFDFDSANLSESSRSTLSGDAESIKQTKSHIRIEGNCDERGSAEYNLALGERRAKAAQKYLVTMGVKADDLSIISYGKEKPAVTGNDESAWAKNRRDDFVVLSK